MFLIDFVSTFIFKIYKVYLFYIISLVYNMVRVGSYVCAGWYLNLPAVCILYLNHAGCSVIVCVCWLISKFACGMYPLLKPRRLQCLSRGYIPQSHKVIDKTTQTTDVTRMWQWPCWCCIHYIKKINYFIHSVCEGYQDICSSRGDNFHSEQVIQWLLSLVLRTRDNKHFITCSSWKLSPRSLQISW